MKNAYSIVFANIKPGFLLLFCYKLTFMQVRSGQGYTRAYGYKNEVPCFMRTHKEHLTHAKKPFRVTRYTNVHIILDD